MAKPRDFDLLDTLAQAFSDECRTFRERLRQDQGKLITAETARRIHATQLFAETVRQSSQRIIPRVVTDRVIELLKAIQIKHQKRKWLMQSRGPLQFAIELHLERAAVVAARERVGERLLLHLREQVCVIDCD